MANRIKFDSVPFGIHPGVLELIRCPRVPEDEVWIASNVRSGFKVGVHRVTVLKRHRSSIDDNVAYIIGTKEMIHYCHKCEDYVRNADVTFTED